jgi:hypothetical protein
MKILHFRNQRVIRLALGSAHFSIAILQLAGIHFQMAGGIDPTHHTPGAELTFGFSHWSRKQSDHQPKDRR